LHEICHINILFYRFLLLFYNFSHNQDVLNECDNTFLLMNQDIKIFNDFNIQDIYKIYTDPFLWMMIDDKYIPPGENDRYTKYMPNLFEYRFNDNTEKYVKKIIDYGISDVGKKFGYTALIVAIFYGEINIVRVLIEEIKKNKKDALNTYDYDGMTALMRACVGYNNGNEIVKILLKEGAQYDIKDSSGKNLLSIACENSNEQGKNYDIVETLLDNGFDDETLLNNRDINGETPFMAAVMKKDIITAELLIKCYKLHKNQQNIYLDTPLIMATRNSDINMSKLLIQYKNCNPEMINKQGTTALMTACKNGDSCVEIVRLLLENNVEIATTDCVEYNAFFYACTSGSLEIVNMILKRHENISSDVKTEIFRENRDKETPFFCACRNGHSHIVGRLLEMLPKEEHLIICEKANISRITPLMAACVGGHIDVVRILLENGCDITTVNSLNENALSHSTKWEHIFEEILKYANKNGIELNLNNKDIFGRTY
jgi:ankyrin repeat protein